MSRRIVTLTVNPAVDIACSAVSVQPTHKIRTFDERLDPGGGGINVARVIRALGGDALALIMTGDVTGRLVEELLSDADVPWQAIPIRGRTRISLSVHDQKGGLEYRFVPGGPQVEPDETRALLDVLRGIEAAWIVASGSLPRGVPSDFYAEVAGIAAARGQKFALDSSGAALRAAVGQRIELLKLSLSELEFLIDHKAPDATTREREVAALIGAGAARKIAVSLGREGALLGSKEGVIHLPAPVVAARSSVGAGDAFLAGLVHGLTRGLDDRDALALAVAAGSAAVSRYDTASALGADVDALYRALRAAPGPAVRHVKPTAANPR